MKIANKKELVTGNIYKVTKLRKKKEEIKLECLSLDYKAIDFLHVPASYVVGQDSCELVSEDVLLVRKGREEDILPNFYPVYEIGGVFVYFEEDKITSLPNGLGCQFVDLGSVVEYKKEEKNKRLSF